MQYVIHHNIDKSTLMNLLPKKFHKSVAVSMIGTNRSTLVVFGGKATEVIFSRTVKKALGEISPNERIVAAAYGFTAEASNFLDERNALKVVLSDFFWTDKSLAYIKDAH